MKAVCVSCFNYYENRLKHVENYLIPKGYEVVYITSNYDHIDKVKYRIEKQNTIQIKVLPYKKNLSILRLISHYFFSLKVFNEINKIKPDLIYIMLPPNFLAVSSSKYKRKNAVKIIFDLYDVWPESFPSNKAKFFLGLFFKFWGDLRNKNLKAADVIVTECNLYQKKLKDQLSGLKTGILFLTKEELVNSKSFSCDLKTINLVYLGSINNLIDIPSIVNLLKKISKYKSVILHVIGDGESRGFFLNEIINVGVKTQYYGKIYDEKKILDIFNICNFGLNIMKNSVCVGLTMKSIDYFRAGLPILNNIHEDTTELVEKYKIGFNINEDNLDSVVKQIIDMTSSDFIQMRKNTLRVFEEKFSTKAFNSRLSEIIDNFL